HPRAQFDEELHWRTRPRDASDQEGQPVVLRSQGAHRRGQPGDDRAFGVYFGGQRGGQTYVARLIARRRAQSMGRWRLSGPERRHPRSRAQGTGYDLPPDQIQELCWRRGQAQEHNQGSSESQGRASVSHLEARLRIYQGALSGHPEKPPMALRGLRASEPIPAPQPVGPSKGVVSPGARNTASRGQTDNQKPTFFRQKLIQNQEIIGSHAVTTKSRTCAEVP